MSTASIVFSGAGSKIMLHAGALSAIEQYKILPYKIVGTSSGSIVATLFSLGYSANEIKEILLEIKFSNILGVNYLSLFPLLYQGYITDGSKFEALLDKYFGNNKFSDLYIDLYVIACDVCDTNMFVFSKSSTPEAYLKDAVRASTAIPLVFKLPEYNGKILCDGGIIKNFAVDLPDLVNENNKVIIGHLSSGNTICAGNSFYDILCFLVENAFNGGVAASINDAKYNVNQYGGSLIVASSSYDVSFIDFGISKEDKLKMFNIGYSNMVTELKKYY